MTKTSRCAINIEQLNNGGLMKKIFVVLVMLLVVNSSALAKKLELKENTFFAISSVFDESLKERFIKKLSTYKHKELVMYFDSPGGSVSVMTDIIAQMKASKVRFKCVARFAASAAFATFQACDERIILENGVLMQHPARGGFSGDLQNVKTLLDTVIDIVDRSYRDQAAKMKMDYKKFRNLVDNTIWMSYTKAIEYKAADSGLTAVTCSKELIEKEKTVSYEVCTLFGCFKKEAVFSECPLITEPVKAVKSNKQKTYAKHRSNTVSDFYWIYLGGKK